MALETRRLERNLLAGALILGILAYALASRDCAKSPGSTPNEGGTTSADEPPSLEPRAGSSDPGATAEKGSIRDAGGPILDREKADRMRAAILAALAAPAEPNGAIPSEPPTRHPGEHAEMPSSTSGDGGALRDYIKSVIHDDYFPLAKQCYEASLAKDPKMHGRISMSFEIVGDKKIGGVVDNAAYDDEETTIIDPELRTCLRESMMSVSFDAPPKDGKVTVKYPITFAPDDPPDE